MSKGFSLSWPLAFTKSFAWLVCCNKQVMRTTLSTIKAMQERNLCARRVSPRLTPDEGYLGYPFFYRIAIRRKKTIKKWATILRFHHYKKTTKGQFGFEIIILWKGMGRASTPTPYQSGRAITITMNSLILQKGPLVLFFY